MLIPKGPHRTFKNRTTKKGVPRQSAHTLSTREKRRARERAARRAGSPTETKPHISSPVSTTVSVRIEYKTVPAHEPV